MSQNTISAEHAQSREMSGMRVTSNVLTMVRAVNPEQNQSSSMTLSVPKWQVPTQDQNALASANLDIYPLMYEL